LRASTFSDKDLLILKLWRRASTEKLKMEVNQKARVLSSYLINSAEELQLQQPRKELRLQKRPKEEKELLSLMTLKQRDLKKKERKWLKKNLIN
jgi:hypothetical protein